MLYLHSEAFNEDVFFKSFTKAYIATQSQKIDIFIATESLSIFPQMKQAIQKIINQNVCIMIIFFSHSIVNASFYIISGFTLNLTSYSNCIIIDKNPFASFMAIYQMFNIKYCLRIKER